MPPVPRSVLESLPPHREPGDGALVGRLVGGSRAKAVVLDDDPTGTQTVHGLDVLADWSVPSLSAALRDPRPCFFVLTNTRSMPEGEARGLVRQVCANLAAASRQAGVAFTLILRSDSTLRGHFAAEIKAAEEALGPFDATLVIPAFFEGGRHTVGDIHYVAAGESLVPAAETEFARDQTFAYSSSNLADWIEEKTGGAVPAKSVVSIGIGTLRGQGGADAAEAALLGLPRGSHVVVNAADYPDLATFTLGLLRAEASGRRYLLRTAASFVRVRAGIGPRPLLSPPEYSRGSSGALVVVGSYVAKTSEQLDRLLRLPGIAGAELRVDALASAKQAEAGRVARLATDAIASGRHAVIYTSRSRSSSIGAAGDLEAGRKVSAAVVETVRGISVRPRLLLSKGGITSCDIAVRALGMHRALVLGQAIPGVPVWELGGETRFPGLRLVVWPGNVGGPDQLRDLVSAC